MRRNLSILTLIILVFSLALGIQPERPALALPEYSAQTGEPCATCHLSPSGGGPRGPRGQAWVGSGKPGAVPDLVQALEVLGVHLEVDESAYQALPGPVAPAEPLPLQPAGGKIHQWLSNYAGN